jgi:predicted enzyme related to lactoylglutathione lyase
MSSTEVHSPGRKAVGTVDMHLEVEIIPVSDVDRSKQFYQLLGWRLDGTGLTTAARDVPARDNHWTGDIHEVR